MSSVIIEKANAEAVLETCSGRAAICAKDQRRPHSEVVALDAIRRRLPVIANVNELGSASRIQIFEDVGGLRMQAEPSLKKLIRDQYR